MTGIQALPEPPYTAVIFTSVRTTEDPGYAATAARMEQLAAEQPGYLGFSTAREGTLSISISYWADEAAARAWKQVAEHRVAQADGIASWYDDYQVQVARVHRAYRGTRSPR